MPKKKVLEPVTQTTPIREYLDAQELKTLIEEVRALPKKSDIESQLPRAMLYLNEHIKDIATKAYIDKHFLRIYVFIFLSNLSVYLFLKH